MQVVADDDDGILIDRLEYAEDIVADQTVKVLKMLLIERSIC